MGCERVDIKKCLTLWQYDVMSTVHKWWCSFFPRHSWTSTCHLGRCLEHQWRLDGTAKQVTESCKAADYRLLRDSVASSNNECQRLGWNSGFWSKIITYLMTIKNMCLSELLLQDPEPSRFQTGVGNMVIWTWVLLVYNRPTRCYQNIGKVDF